MTVKNQIIPLNLDTTDGLIDDELKAAIAKEIGGTGANIIYIKVSSENDFSRGSITT